MNVNAPVEVGRKNNAEVTAPFKPLISVIVPIYNVEKYVRKCLDSLKNQSLKEIEIICIDDGSTDRSGTIADEYETSEYPIFRVFQTENRGLSAARNRGINESRSQWLMFVDSDDWVEAEFCRIPYEVAVRENVDIVAFQVYIVVHGRVKKPKDVERPIGIVDEMTAHEDVDGYAWNKLYRKILFNDIRYPEGRAFEDLATTHKLIHKARKVYLLNDRFYFYLIRKGSITQTHTADNKKDWFVASMERRNDLISYGYSTEKIDLCGPAIALLAVSVPSIDPLYLKAIEIVDTTKGFPSGLTLKQKMGLTVWKTNRSLFHLMCRTLGRV